MHSFLKQALGRHIHRFILTSRLGPHDCRPNGECNAFVIT